MYYLILLLALCMLACCLSPVANSVFDAHRTLNRLVMDYLVIEGYRTAAEEFSKETNMEPSVDLDSIQSRMDIRDAVRRGDIEEAIVRVNDLNPEVSLRTFPPQMPYQTASQQD